MNERVVTKTDNLPPPLVSLDQLKIDFAHLETELAALEAFEILGEIWGRLSAFRSACPQDPFLMGLTAYLENQFVAAALVLTIQAELPTRP
jgi:hypothetical protein